MPFDSTIPLRLDPYRYVSDVCRRVGSDAFETRLLLERAVCLTGVAAARFFYDRTAFRRRDAAPGFLKKTLFGEGGVQGLDGAPHRARKALFVDLLGPERVTALAARVEQRLAEFAESGDGTAPFPLQDRMELLLTDAVCDWAGVPLPKAERPEVAALLSALFEHAGSVGPGHFRARRARRRADDRAAAWIAAARDGELVVPQDRALSRIATWRDETGREMPAEVAAVELLNVLRPFVAISAFVTFAVREIALRPELGDTLRADPARIPDVVQEVRRTAPFFPLAVARAATGLQWRDIAIPEGRLVALDLWGTNRDPAAWDDPDTFRPERFDGRAIGAFELIPQGGGEHRTNHRCPGEWVTIGVMEATLRHLLRETRFTFPEQDLSLDMRALPGLPRDRMILSELRPAG